MYLYCIIEMHHFIEPRFLPLFPRFFIAGAALPKKMRHYLISRKENKSNEVKEGSVQPYSQLPPPPTPLTNT